MRRISLVIYAAGLSSRFGEPKLTQDIHGRKVIDILMEKVSNLPFEKKYIVVRQDDEDLKRIVRNGFTILENPHPERGMSGSIKIGIKALPGNIDGIMMLPGDQPLVSVSHLERVMVKFESSGKGIAATLCDDEIRNPAIFSRKYFSDFMELTGDMGGRKLFETHKDDIELVELDDGRMLEDLDYPQDLAKLRQLYDFFNSGNTSTESSENRTNVSFETAMKSLIKTAWNKLRYEEIPIEKSCGMISGENVFSKVDYPSFRKSAMDGYAINSEIFHTSTVLPLELRITGRITAGSSSVVLSSHEECVEIFTGGEMPENADCVVKYEDVSRGDRRILIDRVFKKGENVIDVGEDFKAGDMFLKKGEIIQPAHISALSQCMTGSIVVMERIRASVISTGNELNDFNVHGPNPNSTQPLLVNWLNTGFMDGFYEGICRDDVKEIRSKILGCKTKSHIILITGGSGSSDLDLVHASLTGISNEVFHGVQIKPGKTISLYNLDGIPVFSVSGLPVAALLSVTPFMDMMVKIMTGHNPDRIEWGTLESDLQSSGKYTSIVPARVEHTETGCLVKPFKGKISGMISILLKSNAYILLEEGVFTFSRGDSVETHVGRW